MSQVELAKASGVAQNTVSKMEAGKHSPQSGTLRKLANALDVKVADLVQPDNWRAVYLEQEADHARDLHRAAVLAAESLSSGNLEYAGRAVEILEEGLRGLSESLHEAHRIETGEEPERVTQDQLNELLREYAAN
jgi:transcriptional regulator with XRE-family HTH domain